MDAIDLGDARPARRLVVLTCMDARLDVFAILGLELGDAQILRNAGARVTGDVVRSLTLSTHLLEVESVVVLGHTGCALVGRSEDELRDLTGADFKFAVIADQAAAVREDIDRLKAAPSLNRLRSVTGFVYDLATGALNPVG